ncbi:lantibiotic immunity ABC transporter MutG family permease subunit [Sporofaciens musculi]|uniref:lantibiotic immunity ABC transporter MutG family permease subunit n=1 Tax=Sporofaciens musculi TaxID=2681861 RepID=UPI0025A1DCBE|nr:lantibiotic immunity ABC transporter MutG family permease subunit [Sporofaciens musculi]
MENLKRNVEELYRNVRGEMWKMRHTLLKWLHLMIPLLGILVFLSYYSFSGWSDQGKVYGYMEVLSIVLPLIVSVVSAMSVELEEKGHFQALFTVTVYKRSPLIAKWMVLWSMGFAAILLAVLGFGVCFGIQTGRTVLSVGEYLVLAVVLWLGSMNLYLLHLFLNLAFSKTISLCMGTVQLAVSALFLTGLGEGRWQFFPCAWGGRWSGYLLQYWKGNESVSGEYVANSLVVGAVVTILFWCGALLWFHYYEGRAVK